MSSSASAALRTSSSILHLPNELLIRIFVLALSHSSQNTITPLSLLKICRPWRAIAISTPRFWSTITLAISDSHCHVQEELLEQWLERTGVYPLDIKVSTPPSLTDSEPESTHSSAIAMVHQLTSHSLQWKTASFFMPGSYFEPFVRIRGRLPLLQSLKVNTPTLWDWPFIEQDLFRIAPKLREANLGFYHILPWDQLTRLDTRAWTIQECYKALSQMTNIVECNTLHSRNGQFPGGLEGAPLTLPSCRIFSMRHTDSESIILLLNLLTLPSLVELTLTSVNGNGNVSDAVSALEERSAFVLQKREVETKNPVGGAGFGILNVS